MDDQGPNGKDEVQRRGRPAGLGGPGGGSAGAPMGRSTRVPMGPRWVRCPPPAVGPACPRHRYFTRPEGVPRGRWTHRGPHGRSCSGGSGVPVALVFCTSGGAWCGLGGGPHGPRTTVRSDWGSKAPSGSQSCRVVLGLGGGKTRRCLQIMPDYVGDCVAAALVCLRAVVCPSWRRRGALESSKE